MLKPLSGDFRGMIFSNSMKIKKLEKPTKLGDWVVCRVWQKNSIRNNLEDQFGSRNEPLCEEPCSTSTNAKLEMVREFLYRDCLVLPLIIGSSIDTVSSISFEASKNSTTVCEGYSDTNYSQYSVPPFDSSINGQKKEALKELGMRISSNPRRR
ncbi:hypothetical protein LOK49_LG10G01765 [Camellia lanceoleosa]|uniref:Uncharacterized protein n=1 Tax=Camellia lanceoleosa TaxID=1840588 RepID=A0ACC0G9S6_9ERIC|nr:hypothetical protein LOK49_LG10G01765 [Camellia lanceoleosa]